MAWAHITLSLFLFIYLFIKKRKECWMMQYIISGKNKEWVEILSKHFQVVLLCDRIKSILFIILWSNHTHKHTHIHTQTRVGIWVNLLFKNKSKEANWEREWCDDIMILWMNTTATKTTIRIRTSCLLLLPLFISVLINLNKNKYN